MNIRIRYGVHGGHVHCRVFVSDRPGVFAKIGELTFSLNEWPEAQAMLHHPHIEFIEDVKPLTP
jgi:hypothetical protein